MSISRPSAATTALARTRASSGTPSIDGNPSLAIGIPDTTNRSKATLFSTPVTTTALPTTSTGVTVGTGTNTVGGSVGVAATAVIGAGRNVVSASENGGVGAGVTVT